MKWLRELFSNGGDASMKRFLALGAFVFAVYFSLWRFDNAVIIAFLSFSGGMLGVAAVTKT